MDANKVWFEVTFSCFFLVLLAFAIFFYWRAVRMATGDWESLIARLESVDKSNLLRIASYKTAEALVQGASDEWNLSAEQMWDLIGGLEGLEAIGRNSDVLVQLACHVQRNYPEALVVAEHLRLHAREIQWHIDRLRGAAKIGRLRSAFPDYAQQAVATYMKMVDSVLSLYESTNSPRLQDVQRAI